MNRQEIDRALVFWRSLLEIEDWRIEVKHVQAATLMFEDEELEGMNLFSPEELYSQILLRRGASEETLVHELLHLVFDGDKAVDKLMAYDHLHERALNRCARAFMKLKGGCK